MMCLSGLFLLICKAIAVPKDAKFNDTSLFNKMNAYFDPLKTND